VKKCPRIDKTLVFERYGVRTETQTPNEPNEKTAMSAKGHEKKDTQNESKLLDFMQSRAGDSIQSHTFDSRPPVKTKMAAGAQQTQKTRKEVKNSTEGQKVAQTAYFEDHRAKY